MCFTTRKAPPKPETPEKETAVAEKSGSGRWGGIGRTRIGEALGVWREDREGRLAKRSLPLCKTQSVPKSRRAAFQSWGRSEKHPARPSRPKRAIGLVAGDQRG